MLLEHRDRKGSPEMYKITSTRVILMNALRHCSHIWIHCEWNLALQHRARFKKSWATLQGKVEEWSLCKYPLIQWEWQQGKHNHLDSSGNRVVHHSTPLPEGTFLTLNKIEEKLMVAIFPIPFRRLMCYLDINNDRWKHTAEVGVSGSGGRVRIMCSTTKPQIHELLCIHMCEYTVTLHKSTVCGQTGHMRKISVQQSEWISFNSVYVKNLYVCTIEDLVLWGQCSPALFHASFQGW